MLRFLSLSLCIWMTYLSWLRGVLVIAIHISTRNIIVCSPKPNLYFKYAHRVACRLDKMVHIVHCWASQWQCRLILMKVLCRTKHIITCSNMMSPRLKHRLNKIKLTLTSQINFPCQRWVIKINIYFLNWVLCFTYITCFSYI